MRIVSGFIVISMMVILLAGCGDQTNDKPAVTPPQSQPGTEPSHTSDANAQESSAAASPEPTATIGSMGGAGTELSQYYVPEQGEVDRVNDTEVVWKAGDITLTAQKNANSVTSIQVKSTGIAFDVEVPQHVLKNTSEVVSIALSSGHEYLAISMMATNIGHQLIVLDLSSGESVYLNAGIDKDEEYESVYVYNWSPVGNKLALAYGYLGSCSLAVYDFDNQSVMKLPEEKPYIEAAFILWNKDGKGFDFISEYPPSQYKLYRYTLETDWVEALNDISNSDLKKYEGFIPARF